MNSKPRFDHEIYRRSVDVIHHGALTNSKRPECHIKGVYPSHATKGLGCYLWDTAGNKYVDYVCALGTNLFGYANGRIMKVVTDQLSRGSIYSLSSVLEVEVAEKLKGMIHFCDKFRFMKTGTEACMSALKIARAHTNRNTVLSEGYHGHSDPFVSLTPPHIGVPEDFHIKKFTALSQIQEDVACVIVEPIMVDNSVDRISWLTKIRDRCRETGTVLIFDEIITGFRYKNLTFSTDTGLYPDIILLGKAIGGGLPLAVIGTRPGIGENKEWFVSGTFCGDTLALAAFNEVMNMVQNDFKINDLWVHGQKFIDGFNSIDKEIQIKGYPTRGVFAGDEKKRHLFFQESCKANILFGPSFFYNFNHVDLNEIVLNSCKDIIMNINTQKIELEGMPPVSPFSAKARE